MKKLALLMVLGALAVSCTNQKIVQYNTERLDKIESYLNENKMTKTSEDGKVVETKEYIPLEKEAEQWFKQKQQQPQEQQ